MTHDEQRELYAMVASDIRFIRENSGPNARDDQIRRVSVDLHKLFLEDAAGECWRDLGFKGGITIDVLELLPIEENLVTSLDLGCEIGGLTIANFRITEGPVKPPPTSAEGQPRNETSHGQPTITLRLKAYLEAVVARAREDTASRREIIQYVALKRGGKHWDVRRKVTDGAYRLLDQLDASGIAFCASMDGPGLDGAKLPVTASMLAIAQQIVNSPDVMQLEKVCDSVVGNQ